MIVLFLLRFVTGGYFTAPVNAAGKFGVAALTLEVLGKKFTNPFPFFHAQRRQTCYAFVF